MISVEPANGGGADALLPQGRFEDWQAGLPAPAGFRAPGESAESTLMRDGNSGQPGATGYTVRQTWTGSGTAASPLESFGVTLHLAPDTSYRLEVIASTTPGLTAAIRLEEGEPGQSRPLARSVVAVRGEQATDYAGVFRTRDGGAVTLSSYAVAGSAFPGTAVWLAWRLEATSDALPPENVADGAARRMLVNQALDQIRGQVALYGGETTWIQSTAPNRTQATQLLREGAATPENVVGAEGFIATRESLAWFERYSAPDASDATGPAGAALQRAEYALNARGAQLVVIPVPERIQLSFDALHPPAASLPLNLSAHARFVDRMLARDVCILDPAPTLWARKSGGAPLFWKGDGDVPSATLRALAEWCAPQLITLGVSAPDGLRQSYTVKVDEIPVEQRYLAGLAGERRASIPAEVHAVQSVRDATGGLFQPDPGSPVLAAGSLAILHHVRGASFAAHLSRALGFPVALPGKVLPDREIPAWIAAGSAPELAGARIVVLCVPERALVAEGWK